MALKLNGKPLDLNPLTPSAQKVKAFLDKAPADELFTTAELAQKARAGRVEDQTQIFTRSLPAYWERVSNRVLWGNPKAIAELRKQVAA